MGSVTTSPRRARTWPRASFSTTGSTSARARSASPGSAPHHRSSSRRQMIRRSARMVCFSSRVLAALRGARVHLVCDVVRGQHLVERNLLGLRQAVLHRAAARWPPRPSLRRDAPPGPRSRGKGPPRAGCAHRPAGAAGSSERRRAGTSCLAEPAGEIRLDFLVDDRRRQALRAPLERDCEKRSKDRSASRVTESFSTKTGGTSFSRASRLISVALASTNGKSRSTT